MVIEATKSEDPKYKPKINVTSSGSSVEFYVDMFIKNPIDSTIDAAKMTAKAQTDLSFFVNDNFLLWGSIQDLNLTVIDYEPYFKTQTSLATINSKLHILLPLMEAYANSMLDDGWILPLSSNITRYLKNQRVVSRDGYILIEGDAAFNNKRKSS